MRNMDCEHVFITKPTDGKNKEHRDPYVSISTAVATIAGNAA
jgi:hypothetical protein